MASRNTTVGDGEYANDAWGGSRLRRRVRDLGSSGEKLGIWGKGILEER